MSVGISCDTYVLDIHKCQWNTDDQHWISASAIFKKTYMFLNFKGMRSKMTQTNSELEFIMPFMLYTAMKNGVPILWIWYTLLKRLCRLNLDMLYQTYKFIFLNIRGSLTTYKTCQIFS